jgi:hypothetical protein
VKIGWKRVSPIASGLDYRIESPQAHTFSAAHIITVRPKRGFCVGPENAMRNKEPKHIVSSSANQNLRKLREPFLVIMRYLEVAEKIIAKIIKIYPFTILIGIINNASK